MDDNATFQGDDALDAARKRLPPQQRTGKMMMLAANGGIDFEPDRQNDEQAPLLGSRRTGNGAGRDEDEERRSSSDATLGWADYNQWDGLPWYKTPSVYWLLFPFILSAMANGGLMIPKINLIQSLICREYYADKSLVHLNDLGGVIDPQCRTAKVQAKVATFTLKGQLISGILSAIIAPKLGALSDRYGRKKIMMFTNFGHLSGEVITIFAANYPDTFPVHVILFGFFLDGLAGSFIASMAISHSYATDCTPPSKRNVIFGYFHGMMFMGMALGPYFAAKVIDWTGGVITLFYIALGVHLSYILLLIFFIPESLSKARQKVAREKHFQYIQMLEPASDWASQLRNLNLLEPLKILYPKGSDSGASPAVRKNLILLASVDGIIFGVGTGAMTAIILYSQFKFAWTPSEQSIFMAIVSISRVVCLLIILPGVTRLFRGKSSSPNGRPAPKTGMDFFELSIIRLAIFFDMLSFLGYTFADSSALFIASGAVASMGGIGSPTLQAALTKHVPPGQIGQLLGALGLIHALSRIVAPAFFNSVYAATVATFPQTIFVILTVVFTMAWLVSWMIKPGVKLEEVEEEYRRRESSIRPDPAQEPLIAT